MIVLISVITFIVGLISGYLFFNLKFKPKELQIENIRYLKGIDMLKTEIMEANNSLESHKRKFENEAKGLKVEIGKRDQAIEKLKEMVRTERAKVYNKTAELRESKLEYDRLMKEYNVLFEKNNN